MKSIKIFLSFLFLVLLVSCSEKAPKIDFKFVDYEDPYGKYFFRLPEGWKPIESEVAMKFASSQSAYEKFLDPTGVGALGAVFSIYQIKGYTNLNIAVDSVLAIEKESIPKFDNVVDATINGKPAKKVTYKYKVTKQLIVEGEKYITIHDSSLWHLDYKVFHEIAESYRPAIDTILKSFQLLEKRVVGKGQTELPSDKYDKYDNQYFSIGYPNNFNTKFPKSQFMFSGNFIGLRQDCNLQIDIFASKNLSVEKVFDQNKVKYSGVKSQGERQISGLKALYVNYSLVKNINSRAYFVVKGDKVYRVTINWFNDEEKNYLPVFEKMLNSLIIK